jgi:hypothetical protein
LQLNGIVVVKTNIICIEPKEIPLLIVKYTSHTNWPMVTFGTPSKLILRKPMGGGGIPKSQRDEVRNQSVYAKGKEEDMWYRSKLLRIPSS